MPTARPNGRPASASVGSPNHEGDTADGGWPGQDLGLPESGPGSVASPPRRLGQFLLDLLVGGLVASAISFPAPTYLSLAVWAVLVTVPVALLGQTPAMVLTGLRVLRADGADRVGAWALARTVSLFFVIPAVIIDRDARGLHDRVSRTVVVRTR
ncbi:RDD family protein [Actinomycetospora sp. OC33-EN08]|uniref:RDD family protein n=1 Tax=Actinomycetospora aurantiaca TaxID=3129233 RepID=A0ABU8MTZ6_9PSEU